MAKNMDNHLNVLQCFLSKPFIICTLITAFWGDSHLLWTGKNTQSNLRHNGKSKMHFAVTTENVKSPT